MALNQQPIAADPVGGGTTASGPETPSRRRDLAARRRLVGWAFMTPFALVNVIVIGGPSAASLYYAFTDWSGLGAAEWIGLANFRAILTDPGFYRAFSHNMLWLLMFVSVTISLGLLGASMLSHMRRGQMAVRVVYFIPFTIASVVTVATWTNLADPVRGIAAELSRLGVPGVEGVAFLGNPTLALPTVAAMAIWHYWGFVVVLFLAAMQGIDAELYEAAWVDGGGRWRQFWHVTLPGIRPTLVFVMLITVMSSLLVFDYIWIATGGGPGGATEVVATLLYKEAFQQFEAGYAAALGLSMSFVSALVVAAYLYVRRMGWNV